MNKFLPTIVIAQFFCTSLWFVGNSIVSEIGKDLDLEPSFFVHLTSAIQLGFITGTLIFSVFTISDRFSPSYVFFVSSILAGLFNLGIAFGFVSPGPFLSFRFLTGFFLAGIYPVGMKLASDHTRSGLGKSLGFLVGALVLGTALPHLIRDMISSYPWKYVVYTTSVLSFLGGFSVLLFVPNGPYRKIGQKLNLVSFLRGFKKPNFRSASFGYFGHMWELYTFWAFVPLMLTDYNQRFPDNTINVSILSFLIIGSGALACVLSGFLSEHFGLKWTAFSALFLSCTCCLFSPFLLYSNSILFLLCFLFFWGFVVIADSPLFSTLVAQNSPEESRGSSLTIVNCIGFGITILSIQIINVLSVSMIPRYLYTLLSIGPILGLFFLWKLKEEESDKKIISNDQKS
ncbi:MFS transporter [Leptospira tipperaryensis]|uniref:MFS transporter n=1 Tax=Leptospira tipperaryensis TaxID=2564040 RepID=A0A1D7UZ60_9LEPT|nr:MFS transporter [Leptospira tipperaryensis]AOP34838.1 MFS transporter [Leptospira tipperaryensis]